VTWRSRLLAALLAGCWLGAAGGAVAADAPAQVSAGAEDSARAALREQPPPWYDSERDGWRRIEVRAPDEAKPPEPANGDRGWRIGGFFGWLMLGLVIAATAWLVWQLVRNLAPREGGLELAHAPKAATRAAADLSALPFAAAEGRQDPERALAEAVQRGDWKRAVAWSFVLHLVALDQAGVIRLAKGVTNRRYLRTVTAWAEAGGGRAPAPAALAATIAVFERVWFGQQPAGQEQVRAVEQGRARLGDVLATRAEP
jgi:hypothetical protein